MQVIKKTRKYLHVRMTEEEYGLLEDAIRQHNANQKKQAEQLAYAKWFFTNHVEINWQDEYSSWHTDWKNIETGEYVPDPGFWVMAYRSRFAEVIKKNKRNYRR